MSPDRNPIPISCITTNCHYDTLVLPSPSFTQILNPRMVAVESHAFWPSHTCRSWETGTTNVQPAIVAIIIDLAVVPSLDKMKDILASIKSTAPVFNTQRAVRFVYGSDF